MRKYQPIWLALKTKGKARIAAHKYLHRRIKKAVIKEKDMDVGYKMELAECSKRAEIRVWFEESVIHFELLYFAVVNAREL